MSEIKKINYCKVDSNVSLNMLGTSDFVCTANGEEKFNCLHEHMKGAEECKCGYECGLCCESPSAIIETLVEKIIELSNIQFKNKVKAYLDFRGFKIPLTQFTILIVKESVISTFKDDFEGKFDVLFYPEHGLHPKKLKEVCKEILMNLKENQLIYVTYSLDFIHYILDLMEEKDQNLFSLVKLSAFTHNVYNFKEVYRRLKEDNEDIRF